MDESLIALIGKRIAKLRNERALTQKQLADAIGYSRGYIGKLETNQVGISPEQIIAFADFFGVSCDYILRGYENADLPLGQKLNLSQETLDDLAMLTDPNEIGGDAFAHFISELPKLDDLASCMQDAVLLMADEARYIKSDYENEDLNTLQLKNGSRIERRIVAIGILRVIVDNLFSALFDGVRREARTYAAKDNP